MRNITDKLLITEPMAGNTVDVLSSNTRAFITDFIEKRNFSHSRDEETSRVRVQLSTLRCKVGH